MDKKMKKVVLIVSVILLAFGTTSLKAQQEPQYTQYMFNMMSVNPAYAGTREALNALMISRLQWVGVEGAPRSHTFALHTPFKDKSMGLGASVIADNIGPVTNTYININYAYRVNLNENMTLSLGLKGGIYNYYAGLSEVQLNESDNAFSSDFKKSFQPNLGAGAYLYTNDYYVGFSVPKLIKTELESVGTGDEYESELKLHYFLTAGYVFELNSEWKLKPSILNKIVERAPPSLDITAQALYMDKFWFGTTYRVGDAIALLFEIQVNRQLVVGYSYDYTLSGMSKVSNGSHEILISYDFAGFSNDKVKSPRYF
jgi:type IX secretion system PorP/SprF family membrane protein